MRETTIEKYFMYFCIIVLLIFLGGLINQKYFNTQKPIVYLQNSEVNEAQLDAYAKGYKAGYQEALKEIEEREYLDGGVR